MSDPIQIQCPNCLRVYGVQDSAIGKKVVCSDPICGQRFIAKPCESETPSVHFAEAPEETLPPPIPIPQIELAKEYYTFCTTGRIFLFSGCVCLVLGMLSPSLVFDDHSGYLHNEPKWAGKLSTLIASIPLFVIGSAFRVASGAPISPRESFSAVATCVIVVFAAISNFCLSLNRLN